MLADHKYDNPLPLSVFESPPITYKLTSAINLTFRRTKYQGNCCHSIDFSNTAARKIRYKVFLHLFQRLDCHLVHLIHLVRISRWSTCMWTVNKSQRVELSIRNPFPVDPFPEICPQGHENGGNTSQYMSSGKAWIPMPPPIRRLFTAFPLQTYPAADLPSSCPPPVTYPRLCVHGSSDSSYPTWDAECLKWQVHLLISCLLYAMLVSDGRRSFDLSGRNVNLCPRRTIVVLLANYHS